MDPTLKLARELGAEARKATGGFLVRLALGFAEAVVEGAAVPSDAEKYYSAYFGSSPHKSDASKKTNISKLRQIALYADENHEEAMRLLRRVIHLYQNTAGEDFPQVYTCLTNVARRRALYSGKMTDKEIILAMQGKPALPRGKRVRN
jgi:hypothetical protein